MFIQAEIWVLRFQILLKKRNICYYHRFKYIAMKVYVASIRVQENINNNCTLFKYSSYIHMYIYIYILHFYGFLSDSIDHLYASWKHVEIVCWNISCSYAALIEVHDWLSVMPVFEPHRSGLPKNAMPVWLLIIFSARNINLKFWPYPSNFKLKQIS